MTSQYHNETAQCLRCRWITVMPHIDYCARYDGNDGDDIVPGNIDCLSCRADETKCGNKAKGFAPIKALSIRQPWTHLILHCGKDIENRDWPTRIFGPVLIHAAKTMTRADYDEAVDFARSLGVTNIPAPADLPRGGIVGAVDIDDCVTVSNSPWFFGMYGFVLSNPRPLLFAPCRGQLGFFQIDNQTLAKT